MKTIRERFDEKWEAIPETGCHWWTGCVTSTGYGAIKIEGKTAGAHRVSYELHVGSIPDGLMILHSCDNPICVNPSHLRVGTGKDNSRDCIDRGRFRRSDGQHNPNSKLSNNDVVRIRERLATGESLAAIARDYGRATSTIFDIKHGIKWPTLERIADALEPK
jgi:hypothetical protein